MKSRRKSSRPPNRRSCFGWAWALEPAGAAGDRKSTRLNSSHQIISYAVFCLKKKKKPCIGTRQPPLRDRMPRSNSTPAADANRPYELLLSDNHFAESSSSSRRSRSPASALTYPVTYMLRAVHTAVDICTASSLHSNPSSFVICSYIFFFTFHLFFCFFLSFFSASLYLSFFFF